MMAMLTLNQMQKWQLQEPSLMKTLSHSFSWMRSNMQDIQQESDDDDEPPALLSTEAVIDAGFEDSEALSVQRSLQIEGSTSVRDFHHNNMVEETDKIV